MDLRRILLSSDRLAQNLDVSSQANNPLHTVSTINNCSSMPGRPIIIEFNNAWLGSRLNHSQYATRVASATAERKLAASLS